MFLLEYVTENRKSVIGLYDNWDVFINDLFTVC